LTNAEIVRSIWVGTCDLTVVCEFNGLNVSLVPAFSSLFAISAYTFFCLALVPTLYKKFGIGPSVNFYIKTINKNNRVPCGPIISRHMAH